MWHDTMLAGCRPVWDFSASCITLNVEPIGSPKPYCCLKPGLKFKRPRAVPSPVHGGGGSSNVCFGSRCKDLCHLNHQQGRRSSLSCKSCPRRSPFSRQCVPLGFKIVSVLAQESRPVVRVSWSPSISSLAVPLAAVTTTTTTTTKTDVELSRITTTDTGILSRGLNTTLEPERILSEDEKLRRHKISCANKGKVPWNKGGKHTPETIRLIKEKTSQAMQSPTVTTSSRTDHWVTYVVVPHLPLSSTFESAVIFFFGGSLFDYCKDACGCIISRYLDGFCAQILAKLRLNARHPQTDETKLKIRDKLRDSWDMKKRIRGYQDILLREWKNCVADAARKGGLMEEEMEWNSYSLIKRKLRVAAAAVSRTQRMEKVEDGKPKKSGKSQEHRQKISEAIKAKWEDPEYKSKVRQGMAKNTDAVKPLKRSPQKRKPAANRAASRSAGVIKGPLDHGFVTAVMSGEKKRHQKELAAKEQPDDNLSSETAEKTKSRPRHRKVDLLKRHITLAESEDQDSTEEEETSAEELSFLAAHSFVDPLASEKLSRLKMLQASRSVMDQKRRESIQHAKTLMAEAKSAANILEDAAGNNESALESLAEIHRLIEEAAQFIQAADSVDGTKTDSGALWRSTMASYEPSNAQLHMESQGKHESTHRQDDSISSNSDSEAGHGHDRDLQSGQDVTVGTKTTNSTMLDGAEVMMFSSEMRESAIWDMHNPFTKESIAERRFPSFVGLLNGRTRSFAAMKETESKALFERWQHGGLVAVENKNGCL